MSLNKEEMIEQYRKTGMLYSAYNAPDSAGHNEDTLKREIARQDFFKARDALKAEGFELPKFDFLINFRELK